MDTNSARDRFAAKRVGEFDAVLGKAIREARLAAGLTQGALASRVGVTTQQILKYELGANRVCVSRLVDIADALDMSPMDLIGAGTQQGEAKRAVLELMRVVSALPPEAVSALRVVAHKMRAAA